MGLFSTLVGCSQAPANLPEILSETEEGFADMVFRITKQEKQAPSEVVIGAQSMANGKKVGFRIRLGSDWEKGKLEIPITTYKGLVILERCGTESDDLLRFMDSVYKTQILPAAMAEATRFTGISLEGKPHALTSGPVKIKLFYESENEDEYAELYLNIDTASQKVYLNEKDEAYRAPIIKDLGKK